jgi:hypothetical protein
MINVHPAAIAAMVVALIAGPAFAQTAATARPTLLDAARLAYEECHWMEAFDAFATLADSGQPEAARVAVLMWRQGPTLYRTAFRADADAVRRWSLLATASIP